MILSYWKCSSCFSKIMDILLEIVELRNTGFNHHFCEDFIEKEFLGKEFEHLTFWIPVEGYSFLGNICRRVLPFRFRWFHIYGVAKAERYFPKTPKSRNLFVVHKIGKHVFTCSWERKRIFFFPDAELFSIDSFLGVHFLFRNIFGNSILYIETILWWLFETSRIERKRF